MSQTLLAEPEPSAEEAAQIRSEVRRLLAQSEAVSADIRQRWESMDATQVRIDQVLGEIQNSLHPGRA